MNKTFPYTYIRKKVTKTSNATIPIQSKAVQYGLGFFTGIRGYYNDKNIYIFRLKDHYKRLKNSAKLLGMQFHYSYPQFKNILTKLIKKNSPKEDIYIRVTIYTTDTTLTPKFHNTNDDIAIYMISLKNYFKTDKGLNLLISSWKRIENNAIPIQAKATGGYINSALAKSEALNKGYDEALFLNRKNQICEATGANIFIIKKNKITTPPLTSNNLSGITRRSLLELFKKELRLPAQEKIITPKDLYLSDEAFLCGTAAQVSWIHSVNKKIISKKEGPITKQIKELFQKVTRNQLKKYSNWLTKI
ncbi:MAG: branched-chain amino acid transaminase [Candidatus Peregrinibacteria bacterium]